MAKKRKKSAKQLTELFQLLGAVLGIVHLLLEIVASVLKAAKD